MEVLVSDTLLITKKAPVYTLHRYRAINHFFALKSSMEPLTNKRIQRMIQTKIN